MTDFKKVAIYDEANFYSYTAQIQKCHLTNEWLYPANSTDSVADLHALDIYQAYKWVDNKWLIVPDYSSVDLYDKNTLELSRIEKGVELPEHLTTITPPSQSEGYCVYWNNDEWVKNIDYRGQFFYSKTTREKVFINDNKEINDSLTSVQPLEFDCYFTDSGWELTSLGLKQEFEYKKWQALTDLNNKCQDIVDAFSQALDVPEFEIKSWAVQSAEAEAWAADNNAATPLLDSIALGRGIDRILLINKALDKSRAYTRVVGLVSGRRQKLEDEIKAAASIDALAQFSDFDSLFADLL